MESIMETVALLLEKEKGISLILSDFELNITICSLKDFLIFLQASLACFFYGLCC